MTKWRVGQKVTKIFHGIEGYKETHEAEITKIADGVIYVDNERGITFNQQGKEIENFFFPMRSEIVPLEE
jgi:hypothetical protein